MADVYIRPLAEADAELSYKWRNDADVWKHTGNRPAVYITPEIEKKWITAVLSRNNEKRFAICVKETDEYIGNVQLTNITGYDAEFHIFIGEKKYWNAGFGTIATNMMIEHAFHELQLQCVYLFVKKENAAAVKMYTKAGLYEVLENNGSVRMAIYAADRQPKTVSVFAMAYNHEKFIAQFFEGIVQQKRDFEIEIVIGEDKSTDGTRDILIEYAKQHEGLFKLILHNENIGAYKNQLSVLNSCKGKYIAVCEADDYWTDSNKLQKQIDFLESNPGYTICWTKYKILKEESTELQNPDWLPIIANKEKLDINLDNIFNPYATLTLTAVFKRSALDISLFNEMKHAKDNTFYCMCLSNGKGAIINFFGGVYRMHGSGTYSAASLFRQRYTSFLNIDEIIRSVPHCNNDNLKNLRKVLLQQCFDLSYSNRHVLSSAQALNIYYKIVRHGLLIQKLKAIKQIIKELFAAAKSVHQSSAIALN